MNKSTKVVKFFSTVVLILMAVSCSNFMKADLKKDIERKIFIANNECPAATVEEPNFENAGVPRNKSIIVSFSLAIDPDTFNSNYDIKDSKGKSLVAHYLEPEWSNDNKLVVIAANETNLIDLGGQDVMDVFFTLDKDCTTKDKLPLKEAVNVKFRINTTTANELPVLSEQTRGVRPEISVQLSESDFYNIPASGAFVGIDVTDSKQIEGEKFYNLINAQNEKTICETNHINSKLSLYIEGSDAGLGNGALRAQIQYRQIYTSGGAKTPGAFKTEKIALSQENEAGNNYANYTLDLSGEEFQDGMYVVLINTLDQYNILSETTKVYFVIRDTQMAANSSVMIWFETPTFRQDFTMDGQTAYPIPFDQEVPVASKLDTYRDQFQFGYISNDTYYVSSSAKHYEDNKESFKYLISWGISLNSMSVPVEPAGVQKIPALEYYNYDIPAYLYELDKEPPFVLVEGDASKYTYESVLNKFFYNNYVKFNYSSLYNSNDKIFYKLPKTYYDFINDNKQSDIIIQACIIDSVGNIARSSTITPKMIDFYGYTVEEISGGKRIHLNYSDNTTNVTKLNAELDKSIVLNYRIFYAKMENDNVDTDNLNLIRNSATEFINDQYSMQTDKPWFDITDSNKYVVYIQPNYSTNSLVSGQYLGQTFGPMYKVVVDPSKSYSTTPDEPAFTVTKDDVELNTGLLNVKINLNSIQNNVTYVPSYCVEVTNPAEQTWVYPEYEFNSAAKTITFKMVNPLTIRAGVYEKEITTAETENQNTWKIKEGGEYILKDDFFKARDKLRNKYEDLYWFGVYVKVKVKAIAEDPTNVSLIASSEKEAGFWVAGEEDDNIPPYQSNALSEHDSHLSFDGKQFVFNKLIREDQGHLNKEFTYYYTPYNEAWGENLSVLSDAEIESLPHAGSYVQSKCYWDWPWDRKDLKDLDIAAGVTTHQQLCIEFNPVIPVNGLPDGQYMFFGKFTDSRGNYSYITLGKANVGTFNKKPVVECDTMDESITVKFDREGAFDKYYICLERFDSWLENGTYRNEWHPVYGDRNELQKLDKNAQSWTQIYNPDFEYKRLNGNSFEVKSDSINPENDRRIYDNAYYRVTIQGFNEHPYDSSTNIGVNKRYGRPYRDWPEDAANIPEGWTEWDNNIVGFISDERSYDLCTEETVSYTTYCYMPGNWTETHNGQDVDVIQETENITSGFSPSLAIPYSEVDFIVNVFTSLVDLGNDPDEWERRGTLAATHIYHPGDTNGPAYYNPSENKFDYTTAYEDVMNSPMKGNLYYAVVVHFADGNSAVSNVWSVYKN